MTCSSPNSVIEKRRFGRRDTFKRSTILLADESHLPCVVVNISQGGALIQIDEPARLDDRFHLLIPEDDLLVACRIAHRTNGKVGVAYIRSPQRASRLKNHNRARIRNMLQFALPEDGIR